MGTTPVDQIRQDGTLVEAPDRTLRQAEKIGLLLSALPGADPCTVGRARAVRAGNRVLLYAQVTHLGRPWPGFKKRIQIPPKWVEAYASLRSEGLEPHFVGIYHFEGTTVFVDFDPTTYVRRKANQSAAHVSTNDIYQAVVHGHISREDSNGNRLSAVRADLFADYLSGSLDQPNPALSILQLFNQDFLYAGRLDALPSVKEMHAAGWPDTFQTEWPGFYLEYRIDAFTRAAERSRWVKFQKDKIFESLDYDLVLHDHDQEVFLGDLKASSAAKKEAPGNDARSLTRCLQKHGRFWYVVYEHDTWHAKDSNNRATIEWNEWKRDVGYFERARKPYNPLSYASRFKEAVDFHRMFVLEVNPANADLVLGEFHQGRQPDGAARAVKVMINKRNIDNFLVLTEHRKDPVG